MVNPTRDTVLKLGPDVENMSIVLMGPFLHIIIVHRDYCLMGPWAPEAYVIGLPWLPVPRLMMMMLQLRLLMLMLRLTRQYRRILHRRQRIPLQQLPRQSAPPPRAAHRQLSIVERQS